MSEERERKIADMAWRRTATKKRSTLQAELERAFGDYEFIDELRSKTFGEAYWKECERHPYDSTNDMSRALAELTGIDKPVFWLHRYTNEAGVLKVRLNRLLEQQERLRSSFGPDLLFADEELSLGVCYEESESGSYLRWWCP